MAEAMTVVVGDWVKVTERAITFTRPHPQTRVVTEVWEGKVTDIKTAGIGCEENCGRVGCACEETEFLVCFTDENSGEMMEWYEWQVEIIRPPVSKGWFLQVNELIESLKHS